jgi:hypothetical protein
MRVVFQEYAWDMGWCDPCAADPLSNNELRKLGIFWLDDSTPRSLTVGGPRTIPPRRPMPGGPQNVFVTRLHLRYDSAHFPEDLVFQETGDRSNFQGRYVLRHAWTSKTDCPAWQEYEKQLVSRHNTEAETLANLTGWDITEIRKRMGISEGVQKASDGEPKWYQKIWTEK